MQGIQCIKELQTPQVSSALHCGCEVCHDIPVRITLNVQHRDNQEPVAAAQIYWKNGEDLQLLGLTDNFGRFIHSDVVGAREITLHIMSPNFIAITLESLTLRPDRPQTTITVNLIPLMNLDVGLGGSPITIRLGTMAAVSAPPSAFTMMDTNETYNDLVTFRGTVMTSSDDNEFIGVPGNSFMGRNEVTNEMEQYGVLMVAYLQFQGVDGESLSSDQIRLGVSLQDSDGNLPPLYLLYYDEDKQYWVNLGPLNPIEPSRKKRQANPVFLEMDNVPIDVFIALAGNENANCWLQARTFAEGGIGDAFPSAAGQGNGPLVSLQQRSDISGNLFLFQFGTDTGNILNTIFAPNAICLPLRCSDFTIATLDARNDAPIGSPSLLPISFNESMFDMAPSAPLEIGTIFTWDELFFPSDPATPNPFYPDFATCQLNAQEANPERGDYFGFQLQPMIDVPLPTETCFIKIQIRDCFDNNDVVVTAINPNTAAIDDLTTFTVERPAEIFTPTTDSSGDLVTMEVPTTPDAFVCDDTTATLRAACLPFVCGHVIQIFVRPNPESGQTGFCQVTGRSIIVNTEIVSDLTNNDQLIITSGALKTTDYNDPNLGFYFDEGSSIMSTTIAQQRCNAGTGVEISETLNLETGVAATFSCF
ncbi:MAG: hypothetical protein MJE68_26835 [Proteobacteria bacterium]|nr:hypothetical protein [Pseudomonadota bacterium]